MLLRSVARLAAASAFVAATIACTPGAATSPQAASAPASAPAASASAGASPSADASASAAPSGSAGASGSPSASGGATAEPSGVADADITVTGLDYAFAGIPDDVPAGSSLGLRNEGTEVHEMLVIRINDDVTQTFQELLALPQAEAMELATTVGHTFANPGEDGEDVVTVDEPGNYGMVCFIPMGTTSLPEGSPGASAGASPDAAAGASPAASGELGSGPPHFALGMVKAFTVSE